MVKHLRRNLAFILAIVFVLGSIFPIHQVQAEGTRGVIIPLTRAPVGTILDRTPAYTWKAVAGVSAYQFQVWQGTTRLLNRVVDAGACGYPVCSRTPDYTLGFQEYKWRLRALSAGTWQPWTEFVVFNVSPPPFFSGFNGSMHGWKVKGSVVWSLLPTSVVTRGKQDYFANLYRFTGRYTDFVFTARLKRTTANGASCVNFRMGSALDPVDNAWYPGYRFCLSESWQYFVERVDGPDRFMYLVSPTSSSVILYNNWNDLTVSAEGKKFVFYVNGTLLSTIEDETYKRGFVGISMFKSSSISTKLEADWARLIVLEKGQ